MKITNYSTPLWVIKNGLKNERGDLLTFKEHLFLFDIYRDMSKQQAIKKCSQVGVSVTMNLKVFHTLLYKKLSVIYTMPSDSDVEEFVKTKTDKIFSNNPELLKEIKVDNTFIKQIGERFIHFKGTRSKAAPISTTADVLVHDEIDRSDLNIIEQYQSRITRSKFRGTWALSNPSIKNVGIDIMWNDSDKKEWFITCLGCKKEQWLEWDKNVDEIGRKYVCSHCGRELTDKERGTGEWKATSEGKVSGYHISQMMAPWMSADDLVEVKEKKGVEYFNNFILGEPYSIGDELDFRQILYDCWTPKEIDKEPFIMGVDVGKIKHYVLGSKKGIFKIGSCESRKELESIINHYNPTVVMDAGPERTWAEEFKQKYPKLSLCFYRYDKDQADLVKWGGESQGVEDKKNIGYCYADRNRCIDKMIDEMQRGNILFQLTREDLERVISHFETLRRVIAETSQGTKRYVWETTTGMDHFPHALNYYNIAKMRTGEATFISDTPDKKEIIELSENGFRMRDLKDIIEEQNE